jgi:hypothetical protein
LKKSYAPNHGNIPSTAILCLKVLLIFFPIAWFLGFFPPIDAFFLWLLEQCYIHIYGGTATATSLRLLVQLTTAVIISVIVNYIPNDIACVALLATFGYILSSFDVLYIIEWLHHLRTTSKTATVVPAKKNSSSGDTNEKLVKDSQPEKKKKSQEFPLVWQDWLFHIIMLPATICVSLLFIILFPKLFTASSQVPFQVETVLLYIACGIFILCKACGDFGSVYWFFGLIRNPFYPKEAISTTATSVKPKKKKKKSGDSSTSQQPKKTDVYTVNKSRFLFRSARFIHTVLLRICAPLLLCAVISIDCSINKVYNDSQLGFWRVLIVLRAFRWVCFFTIL